MDLLSASKISLLCYNNLVASFPHLTIFILGLIVGSFLNVVIYRYNTGRSVARGRSRCLACSRDLHWFELVPVASFVALRGRCRRCLSGISWQYPLVELVTGLLFLLASWQFGVGFDSWPVLGVYLVILSLLVVITVYDFRHKIIPDGLVYAFILFSTLPVLFTRDGVMIFNHLIAGLTLFAFFFLLWSVSRGRWMGFGDAKLALGVGFLLGLTGGVSAIVFAFWFGALVSVCILIYGQLSGRARFGLKSEVPFAPFIVLGLFLNLFFHLNVIALF